MPATPSRLSRRWHPNLGTTALSPHQERPHVAITKSSLGYG